MGFFGDMLDDLGPDGLFATPEERAQQRGVRRAKEELARREHLDRTEPTAPSRVQAETENQATAARPPGFFGNLLDNLDPDELFATSVEPAEHRGIRQAKEEIAYREHLAQADADVESTEQTANTRDADPPLSGLTGWMLMGLLVLSPILTLIAGYSVTVIWGRHLLP